MSKTVLIIDTPTNCYECPCFMDVGWRCQCRMDINEDVHDGRPDWCPLKPYKDAIPIERIKEYTKTMLDKRAIFQIEVMIERWEAKSGADK